MGRGQIEKRGMRRRRIKPVILVVTEGSQTEPKYFEHFRNRRTNIDILVVGSRASSGETDYISLVRKANDYRSKNQLSSAHGDSLWVVADGDINFNNADPISSKNTQLAKARTMADRNGIQLAISNPCFELWFLLHFRYTTAYLRDYTAVVTALKAYIPNYTKNGDVTPLLTGHIEDAIKHALPLENYHQQNEKKLPFDLSTNPFSEVYRLVELLK